MHNFSDLSDDDLCKELIDALMTLKCLRNEYNERLSNAMKNVGPEDRKIYWKELHLDSAYAVDGWTLEEWLFPLKFSNKKKEFFKKLDSIDLNEEEKALLRPVGYHNA